MDDFNQEDYRGKGKVKGLTMNLIILEQIKTIAELGSKEFRGGYDEETIITIDGQPQIIKKYIEDGRQAYCNAVHTLSILMINHLVKEKEKDKTLLDKHDSIKKELEDNHKDYLEELEQKDTNEQEIKYEYLSIKRQLCEKLLGELMVIFSTVDKKEEEEELSEARDGL